MPRYVMVSAAGAEDPPDGDDVFSVYFRAKVPREDVAAVLDTALHEPRAEGRVLYVNAGQEPLEQALLQAL